MMTSKLLVAAGVFWIATILSWAATPEAFEAGPQSRSSLPRGKEADGIVGDFILRNDRVEAVISANLPGRKANMSTFYPAITPGCLYDLTLRGQSNDQITIFAPSSQQGPGSYVRVAEDGAAGEARIETVVTGSNNTNLFKRHEYRLREGWSGVLIVTTLRNEGAQPVSVPVADRWTSFLTAGVGEASGGIHWADAVDPADRAGYAYAWIEWEGRAKPTGPVTLQPGQSVSYARFLAVGQSPADAAGIVAGWLGKTGRIEGSVLEAGGQPVAHARIDVPWGGNVPVPAYPDRSGRFAFAVPPGTYALTFLDLGRPTVKQSVTVTEGGTASVAVTMEAASAIALDVRDEQGRSLPCKAQFLGIGGTSSPNLGPLNRAHGCRDQYHSATGQFRVQVPPGRYRVVVTRGIEFTHLSQDIEVAPGQTRDVKGVLRRGVDTRGWISADFHNHSTPSGDNTCGTDDRIINLAAEHIEFAPTTEHNRFYDWLPHIVRLGLSNHVATVPGIELTGSGAHFNAFPFAPNPWAQDGGAPAWHKDPRITAVALREHPPLTPERWLQINHPDMIENFVDRNGDGLADGGFLTLGPLVDALETLNGSSTRILDAVPYWIAKDANGKELVAQNSEFIWLQLLNRGNRLWCVAVSDAHTVHDNGVGGWRIYVPSRTDEPGAVDWREISENAKAGRIVVTTGPFLDVRTADGTIAGGLTRADRAIRLQVSVQCTDWIEIDRVQVLVNGRPKPSLNFTRTSHPDWFQPGLKRFDRTLEVSLSEDSHLIVVACGENFNLATGYGTSPPAKWRPCAYNNPIFVDVDGGGFKPNGDTLGWELPVKNSSVTEVRRLLLKSSLEPPALP